jgi:ring-1,2-phenylacetyl-CoA epoxidase subunit PaaD
LVNQTVQTQPITVEAIWIALNTVSDPEIPVVSLVEMGVIRDVQLNDQEVVVTMTPTFSGCPALLVMETDIKICLEALGIPKVTVETTFDPPWTSDWITAEARGKLKGIGLAPPPMHNGSIEMVLVNPAICPYCNSEDTSMRNSFGPTACRMIFYCNHCNQPFEQFKPL